ncbi:assimilatory sulfite reductase [Panus rudis PR-1116 ss-1]|nr:assimilatory sulfite reductase [Panus rudis PR-1116 ss-1]
MSGTSTPLSTTSTLSVPPSPTLKASSAASKAALLSASAVIEQIAAKGSSSSAVYIYDLAEQAGFGTLTKSWSKSDASYAPVVSLQTRAGAGLSLVGRLSQGSSKDVTSAAALTAYNTPPGLAAMTQSLSYLPPPSSHSRLVLQVPTVTPVGERFSLSPTLAPLTPVLPLLPEHFTILLSAVPQESVDLAALAYRLTETHVIHIFDHFSATREFGKVSVPRIAGESEKLTLKEGLSQIGYDFFDYVGDKDAQTVIVGLNGPLLQYVKAIASRTPGLGVVAVRVLRPWDEDALRAAIPASAKDVHVLDDVPTEYAQGGLYLDVFSSLLNPLEPGPTVKSHRITPALNLEYTTSPSTLASFILSLVSPLAPPVSLEDQAVKKVLFFSTPKSSLSAVPRLVEQTFLPHTNISSRLLTDYDILSKPGGVEADRLLLSTKEAEKQFIPASLVLPLGPDSQNVADFLAVLDPTLLKSHSLAVVAKAGSPLLVVSNWAPAELVSNIAPDVALTVREKQLRLCLIDAVKIASELSTGTPSQRDAIQNVVVLLAFLRLYLGKGATQNVVLKLAQKGLGDDIQGVDLQKIAGEVWEGLIELQVPEPPADETSSPLKHFEFNAIAVETEDGETVVNGAKLGSWHDAAKHILFPSAFTPQYVDDSVVEYEHNTALRPEVPEQTFLVTCTVNRRLTPTEYDRNVFHLEFDTRGTGLKYEIGEALGVHGWNDADEVLDFCSWYGVDPNRVITIPVPGGDGTKMHTRTVFQALQQQIDLFGKPTKTFYSDLSAYATRQTDKYALQFIGSPEGVSTFKKLSEKDTVTFADILRRYDSARPGIERLCELIGDIKPRHYSIASSQAVVGDRVDLLVVTVEWLTPSGSPRYGQCTRYLAGLKVGQKVTVSIRPSVMKLPPEHTQPIIMAGLGTGAAPFRAFLQYRAWLAQQNIPVGPTYYYFGSRHRSQEYLYGEEIEAFILDGTITHAGLAFSRDQRQKIYIQHKMREDGKDLARLLLKEKGVFYLCGPTWPVPDVHEALVDALAEFEGLDPQHASTFLEELKEEERYVLEVY